MKTVSPCHARLGLLHQVYISVIPRWYSLIILSVEPQAAFLDQIYLASIAWDRSLWNVERCMSTSGTIHNDTADFSQVVRDCLPLPPFLLLFLVFATLLSMASRHARSAITLTYTPFPEPDHSRSTARQKLACSTHRQFQELFTDVYDELMQRKNNTSDNEGRYPSLSSSPGHS